MENIDVLVGNAIRKRREFNQRAELAKYTDPDQPFPESLWTTLLEVTMYDLYDKIIAWVKEGTSEYAQIHHFVEHPLLAMMFMKHDSNFDREDQVDYHICKTLKPMLEGHQFYVSVHYRRGDRSWGTGFRVGLEVSLHQQQPKFF